MTQLYATIKRTSEHYHQNTFNGAKPIPFNVDLIVDGWGSYHVQGGVGGQYRLCDVTLYMQTGEHVMARLSDGKEFKIN